MPLYRLRESIRVRNLIGVLRAKNCVFEFTDIAAGETVESMSGPNKEGRVLIRHAGYCYRAYKEELQNEQIAQRLENAAPNIRSTELRLGF